MVGSNDECCLAFPRYFFEDSALGHHHQQRHADNNFVQIVGIGRYGPIGSDPMTARNLGGGHVLVCEI